VSASPAWSYESNSVFAGFGRSVATAGDVNGDGYSDVIVGAPLEGDGLGHDPGKAYLFLGGSTGPSATPAWTSQGNSVTGSAFGAAVAPAGDVNGDGYDDVLVGAPGSTVTTCIGGGGSVYLFLGTASGLQASWAWSAQRCGDLGANFGAAVGPAGDVNGDGYADVIVGSPDGDTPLFNAGLASLYLGSPSGPGTSPGWTIVGAASSAHLGCAVGTAGDVNADGYADVIVGAYQGTAQDAPGEAHIYFGSPSGLGLSPATTLTGLQSGSSFGRQAGPAGDVNGDGYADVYVTAPDYDGFATDIGAAYVYPGGSSGVGATPLWFEYGFEVGLRFGAAAGSAGDVNGDGLPDLIIGTPEYPAGSNTNGWAGLWCGTYSIGMVFQGWQQFGSQAGENLGVAVGTAGDVNGDGYSDVIVGSGEWANGQVGEGRAQIWLGAGDPPVGTAGWFFTGLESDDGFGWSVCTSGDFNGDGYSDLLVGMPLFGAYDVGALLMFFGGQYGPHGYWDWGLSGAVDNEQLGISVAACDVNNDGYDDIIAGGHTYQGQGTVIVCYGGPDGPDYTIDNMLAGTAGSYFGASVATAGDVNGDGYGDVIIGAPNNGNIHFPERGAAFVYLGSASGLAASPVWSIAGNQDYAHLGTSVASAGDVNGDGFSDVLVGVPDWDLLGLPSEFDKGYAAVFQGGPSGPLATPAWSISGAEGSRLGSAVASAGDVDGDGFSDVVVSAIHAPGGGTEGGTVSVYRGSASGLSTSPWWSRDGGQSYDGFGSSVACAGDVNGDGLSDVLVGAVFYDSNGYLDNGAVFVYGGPLTGASATTPLCTARGSGANWINVGHAVAGGGDLNGDGFADFVSGAPGASIYNYRDGQTFAYYGGGIYNANSGWAHAHQQMRTSASAPLSLLGSTGTDLGFGLRVLGGSPAGRTRLRMQWEVAALGTPFSAASLVSGPWQDGVWTLDANVTGLSAQTAYHWRLRVQAVSPYFPRSPWLSPPANGPLETDLRTGGASVAVGDRPGVPARLQASVVPNPFNLRAVIQYAMPRAGWLEVGLYDVSGRLVTTLYAGEVPAGPGQLVLDGRTASGAPIASGLYFARLRAAGEVITRKLLLAR